MPISFIAPYVQSCLPSTLRVHVQNDWLMMTWLLTFGCVASVILSIGLLIHACQINHSREIFDYTTGLAICLIFLVGCMYFNAGSYPSVHHHNGGGDAELGFIQLDINQQSQEQEQKPAESNGV